jgi:Tol biopolymer transport system component
VLGPFDSGVAGTPPRPVLDVRSASWSPNGARVAFAAALGGPAEARAGGVQRGLFVVEADGTNLQRIAMGDILDAQWSPDGQWIAFSKASPSRPDVFVIHPDGTGLENLTSASGGLASWGPVWAPDGSALVFVRNRYLAQFGSNLWFVKVGGSDPTQLTTTPAEYFSYGWSSLPPRST